MKMNNFDEELEQALLEYVQNTEVATNEKVEFSEKHKKKMEKLFEDVRNSDFKEIAFSEIKGNAYRFNVRKFARVAVFIILALLITIAVTPSMVAWRKDKLDLYGGESGEYSWILPNDITDILENDTIENEDFINVFGYLPEGYKIEKIRISDISQYINIKINEKNIDFKVFRDFNQAIDTEKVLKETLTINGMEMFFIEKNGESIFIWNYNGRGCRLYGAFSKEEMIKIIENIDYEEIEKNF